MPVYKYVGRDVLDRRRVGRIEADNEELAREILFTRGVVTVEKLKEDKSFLSTEIDLSFLEKISLKDLLIFTRQLHAMVNAGIPLVTSLKIIQDQIPNKKLRKIINELASFIEEGGRFSTALNKYKNVFGDLYINMIRAAEEAGTLEETLRRLALYLEKIENLRGKVKSALFYPVMVLVIATIIVTGILLFVIPTFQKLYEDLGGQLPALTQMVINMSQTLRDYIGWVLLGFVVFIIVLSQIRKIPQVKFLTDIVVLRIPIFGNLILKSNIASFARTFSSMIASGLNILDALTIAAKTTSNEVIRRAIENVKSQVERGIGISTALSRNSIFPPMLVNMVATGEEAGNMDEMLAKVAEFYEEEIDRTVDALTSLIEPMMMVFIGGVIGFIIIAMYLPIFKMGELIR
jgi:type IV pilus assembly protein PilC